jgi:hypothetical protein
VFGAAAVAALLRRACATRRRIAPLTRRTDAGGLLGGAFGAFMGAFELVRAHALSLVFRRSRDSRVNSTPRRSDAAARDARRC